MSEQIKEFVKKTYTKAVTEDTGCCGPSCCSSSTENFVGEDYSNLPGYVENADFGLGCGLPTETAYINPGDTVLDLGSGAGNDVFIARNVVGTEGKVIGVDMTEAMIAKANENNTKLGFDNVEFRLGEIENLPVKSDTVDVVVSNCVMNLVPDKKQAFSEVHRVIKKGGHFSISDIVLGGDLPKGILEAAEMYAGCVAGALLKDDYLSVIKDAGFTDIKVLKERAIDLPDETLLKFIDREALEKYRKTNTPVLSITVYAEKN